LHEAGGAQRIVSGDFPWSVKYQRRKTLALHVLADGSVEVRAPLGLAERHIVRFVEERADWVVRTRQRQDSKHRWQNAIEPGASLWYLGTPRMLEVHASKFVAVQVDDARLRLFTADPFNLPGVARQLEAWWREQAAILFRERLALGVLAFPDIEPPALRLRKMRRRWGSCSSRGHITLNTELIKLPLTLIDYVIAHELCHLFEFNHSPRFYRRLQEAMPDWRQREAMLRQF
jgi:predicted metal-dependent hydrolase